MRVLVFGKQYKEKDQPEVQEAFDALQAEGLEISVYEAYAKDIEAHIRMPKIWEPFAGYENFRTQNIDFVMVLGGIDNTADSHYTGARFGRTHAWHQSWQTWIPGKHRKNPYPPKRRNARPRAIQYH